jgi:bidirectional [NiFe] hydrogenase diaphorase subunit
MYNLLDKFSRKEATPRDLVLLEKLCDMVRNTSLCGLGQTAPNPVMSTLRYFRHEYMAAITQDAADLFVLNPALSPSHNGATRRMPEQEVAS